MATRLLIAAALAAVVVAIALVARRRARPAPPPRAATPMPGQLDRADFPRPGAPWLVAYFWSRTCDSCIGMAEKVAALESPEVATCALEAADRVSPPCGRLGLGDRGAGARGGIAEAPRHHSLRHQAADPRH